MARPIGNAQRDHGPRSLSLARALRREIEACAERGYPSEACGLLIGRIDGDGTRVEGMTLARNLDTARARDRYVLDPDDFAEADRLAARRGLDVVGVWHSHPDHPSVPSKTDLDAAWPDYSYVIVSVVDGRAVETRSWRLDGDHFEEERLNHE